MLVTYRTILGRGRSETGFTLIEVLVASALAIVVLGGVLAALESSQRVQARDTEWALTLQEGRAGLARMAHEIRQASKVEKAEASTVLFLATVAGKKWEVKYECNVAQSGTTYQECVRFAAEEGKSLPTTGTPIVRDLTNGASVFSYSPTSTSPTVVTLKMEIPAKGTLTLAGSSGYSHNVVLEDASFMRNLDLSG
jgi:Tfp pilus assembly protein PilW